jgi:hypothetical protein
MRQVGTETKNVEASCILYDQIVLTLESTTGSRRPDILLVESVDSIFGIPSQKRVIRRPLPEAFNYGYE